MDEQTANRLQNEIDELRAEPASTPSGTSLVRPTSIRPSSTRTITSTSVSSTASRRRAAHFGKATFVSERVGRSSCSQTGRATERSGRRRRGPHRARRDTRPVLPHQATAPRENAHPLASGKPLSTHHIASTFERKTATPYGTPGVTV